jgi:[1-hydroxy-2-(trimethylamino)ethyl]phosphonate dioxygenase
MNSVSAVVELFARWGSDPYDEVLTQHDHAAQAAALAVAAQAPDELVAAALLHDIGHLVHLERTHGAPGPLADDLNHEAVGARLLAPLFPPAVTKPVALHVRAKRYLCSQDPTYAHQLSSGSRASLERQGGSMNLQEAEQFARHEGAQQALALRRWDDEAKVVGLEVPPVEHYVELLERVQRNSSDRSELR